MDPAPGAPLITRPAAWRYRRTLFGAHAEGRERIDQPRVIDVVRARWLDADPAELPPYWRFESLRRAAGGPTPASAAESIGRVLGETLACFGLHVIGEARRQGLRSIWFLSRDGYLMLRAHRILRRALDPACPRGRYLMMSRVSARSDKQSVRTFLDRAAYDGGALIDLGWRGTIQNRLAQLGATPAHGIYLALALDPDRPLDPDAPDRQGYLADNHRGDWLETFVFRHFAVFETLCRAPHRSPVGYLDGRPVLSSGLQPVQPGVAAVQREALATVRRWAGVAAGSGFVAADLRAGLLERWRRLLHHPSRAEAELISSLVHDEPLLDPPPFERLGGVARPDRDLGEQLEANYWPPGMLRLSRGPAACLAHEWGLAGRAGEGEWL